MMNRSMQIVIIITIATGLCCNSSILHAWDSQLEVQKAQQEPMSVMCNELLGKGLKGGLKDTLSLGLFMGTFNATTAIISAFLSEMAKPVMGSFTYPLHLTRSWLETLFIGAQHFEHNELVKLNNLIVKHVQALQKAPSKPDQWLLKRNFIVKELQQTLETLKARSIYYGPKFKKRTITPLNWLGRACVALISLEQRDEISKKLCNAIECMEDFIQKITHAANHKDFIEYTKDNWQLNLICSNLKEAATLITVESTKERFQDPNAANQATANFGGLDMFNQNGALHPN